MKYAIMLAAIVGMAGCGDTQQVVTKTVEIENTELMSKLPKDCNISYIGRFNYAVQMSDDKYGRDSLPIVMVQCGNTTTVNTAVQSGKYVNHQAVVINSKKVVDSK